MSLPFIIQYVLLLHVYMTYEMLNVPIPHVLECPMYVSLQQRCIKKNVNPAKNNTQTTTNQKQINSQPADTWTGLLNTLPTELVATQVYVPASSRSLGFATDRRPLVSVYRREGFTNCWCSVPNSLYHCQPNTPKITLSVSQTHQRLHLLSAKHQRLHFLSAKHTKDDTFCQQTRQRLQLVSQTCQRLQLLSAKYITTSVSQTCQRLQLLSAKHTKDYNLC